jgi:hypothetical protein
MESMTFWVKLGSKRWGAEPLGGWGAVDILAERSRLLKETEGSGRVKGQEREVVMA